MKTQRAPYAADGLQHVGDVPGILTLLIPELIYYAASIGTNLRLWWVLSLVRLTGGAIGRLVDQASILMAFWSIRWKQ